jgi:hypothetical protein
VSTPPAGGPQPFGQPQQQPFGQQPFGEQPTFGDQSGFGQQQQFGQAPFPTAQPHDYGQLPKRRNKRRIIQLVVAAVVVIAGVIVGIYSLHTSPGGAQVGDCLSGDPSNPDNADAMKKTDCTSNDAQYKVVGRLDDKTRSDFDKEDCSGFPTADAAFWENDQGDTGAILCLQSIKSGS